MSREAARHAHPAPVRRPRPRRTLALALAWAAGVAAALALLALAASATAASGGKAAEAAAVPDAVARRIRQALPATPIRSIRPAPVAGLYEVVAGRNVLYAEPTGRYLLVGHIYDLATATDVTAARKAEIAAARRIPQRDLPLAEAGVRYGEGPVRLVVFSDPTCPWCRKLNREVLRGLEGVEVVELMFPIRPGARPVAEAVLCADDPAATLAAVFDGKRPGKASDACRERVAAGLDAALAAGRRHGVAGTPTLVAPDGRVHEGFLARPQLVAWLRAGDRARQGADADPRPAARNQAAGRTSTKEEKR